MVKPTEQLLAEVETIMERRDEARLNTEGGYPSEWMVTETHVIVATSNYKGPKGNSLEFAPIEEWVEANEHWLGENWLGDEDPDSDPPDTGAA